MLYRISMLVLLVLLISACVPIQTPSATQRGANEISGTMSVEVSKIEMSDPQPAIVTSGTLNGQTLTITWDGTLNADEIWYLFSTTVNWVEIDGREGGQAMEGFEFFTKENEITFTTEDSFDGIAWSVAKATVLGIDDDGYYILEQLTEGGHDSIIVNFK